jgi:Rrf2 family protein
VPRNYLSKILHRLSRRGLLASRRGRHGGFLLAVPAQRLTIDRIVACFDAPLSRRSCLLGRPRCSDRAPCPAHTHWKAVAERIATFFRETTVADLLGRDGAEHASIIDSLHRP